MLALADSLVIAQVSDWKRFLIYALFCVIFAPLKLRLPGLDGAFSLNFIPMLLGITYFTLGETTLAACLAAAIATLANRRTTATLVQTCFNTANLVLSVTLCFHVTREWLSLSAANLPIMLALAAAIYFVSTTVVVSGVLSLLNGAPFRQVCASWYPWTFPYYIVGAMAVGIAASGRASAPLWAAMLPLLYMIHFFLALAKTNVPGASPAGESTLPRVARNYAYVVIAAGALAVSAAVWEVSAIAWARLAGFAVITVVTAGTKIRLPGLTGTLSFGFVPVLVAILEFSLAEAVILAAATTAVQLLWQAKVRPSALQITFNIACMVTASAAVYGFCRAVFPDPSLTIGKLAATTVLLYLLNSLMVAAILSLLQRVPLLDLWRQCYFWTLPYYSVGSVIVAVMIFALHHGGWPLSLAVLPVTGMLFFTYRMHVDSAVGRLELTPQT